MSMQQNDASFIRDELGRYTRQCAQEITIGKIVSTLLMVKAAQKEMTTIQSVMQLASDYAGAHVTIPQEVEWLLDNWYIAEREGKSALSDMKSASCIHGVAGNKEQLVVSQAAEALVRFVDGRVTAEHIEVFLDAFQDVVCLTESELSVFIPSLRLALISGLAEACIKLKSVLNDDAASDGLSSIFEKHFTSLRFLSGFDAYELLESVNRVERTLRLDPAGVYPTVDEQTRFAYRNEIARIAKSEKSSAADIAEMILSLARENGEHVGTYIFIRPLGRVKKERSGALYIGFIVLCSLFVALLISFVLDNPLISVLLLLPMSEFIKNVTDYFILRYSRTRRIDRLDLQNGVPAEGRTLCVIALLVSNAGSAERAVGLLEEYRLANRDAGSQLCFALSADLPDAETETTPADNEHLKSAAADIRRLNEKYGGGFFLLCRGRTKNTREGLFIAWERKRGAILELCRYLRAKPSRMRCLSGAEDKLTGIRYVIALDSDTRLCAGSACELIGAAMHPLNTPIIDEAKGIVTSGYGVIQPRISVDLKAANQTGYTRIFAGQGGIDPYGGMTGDIYQNLFGVGSFAGKGIIDINAYLACLDTRFPENSVLSHDLLEGAYLRCGFAGDIELTDGYPAKVTTYYDRMHRWTRGDWQSLPWLSRTVRDANGIRHKNNLRQLDRWKIADNLRRSLVPVFSLLSLMLGMLLDNKDILWAALVAVLAAVSHLIITSAAGALKRRRQRVRYHCGVISGFAGQLFQTVIRLILLPYEAWVCLHAIVTALYRMFVSHRRMLAWVTAADSERQSNNTVIQTMKRLWPTVLVAILIAVLTPFKSAIAVAVIWALAPVLVIVLSRDKRCEEILDVEEKLILSRMAGDIWRYFDELLTLDDHYLPPDNFQDQPSVGIAHRTSPTNIGLALLSALAAYDLGICDKAHAVNLVSKILETIKILPKWNGHLYNWYDTQSLSVLQPAYVSTVDSGNFAGSLIALREGLLEIGEKELAETTGGLLSAMRFTPLFDKNRQLFYIGLDITNNKPTQGWYDLLASEARQTSYLAIARGDIPRKHWKKLGRSLVAMDGYRGMASWTGTMFEYFMPELLLPCYPGSLIDESLKFCLYVQKKLARNKPWGMSESAFYAFDHTLSYQYKAHGVQRLALKRGMGRDFVVSPYSTFLSLPLDPKPSINNLKRFQKLGMEGRYGLYEAVDFTPVRLRGRKHEIVRTFMAHHLGMSLVSIDNVLNDGIMQRRFMRDREMASFAELLQEKVPIGGLILRHPPRDVPEKPARCTSQSWGIQCDNIRYRLPRCTLLGNGAYNVLFAETGQSRSSWNGVSLTKTSADPLGPDTGMSFFLRIGDELISLLPTPIFDDNVRYSAELSGARGIIIASSGSLRAETSVSVPENESGELREIEITSSVHQEAELICYFEPVLSRLSDYNSHPAFSKLSLETAVYDGSLIVTRRPRAGGRGIALAFDCNNPFSYDTSREIALGRGGLLALNRALQRSASGTTGAVLDPCVILRVALNLQPGIPCNVAFSLTTAASTQAASAAAKRILSIASETDTRTPYYARLDETAQRLKLGAEDVNKAMALLPEIIYPAPDRDIADSDAISLTLGQQSLWSSGISGDLPIVTAEIDDEDDIDKCAELLSTHRLLTESGVSFDLVYLISGGGDYHSKLRGQLTEALCLNESGCRFGARGGVHLVDAPSKSASTLRAVSVGQTPIKSTSPDGEQNGSAKPAMRPFLSACAERTLQYRYNTDNSFSFDIAGRLPHVAWSHMLANDSFGYLATDAGSGHMWHLNARENKVNRWLNDALATEGTEKLELVHDGIKTSLFAASDGFACRVTYGFGWVEWKKRIGDATYTTTAFVPSDTSARIIIIEAAGTTDFEVSYYTDLTLCPDEKDSVYVQTSRSPDFISARNLYNIDFPETIFHLMASEPEDAFTCSAFSWRTGHLDGRTGTGFTPCAAAVYKARQALVLVTGCDTPEKLRALADVETARGKLRETADYWHDITSALTIHTPDDNLNHFVNGWATYQTLACRIFGRSSLYQSGGAFGFRDQLQDICSLLEVTPDIARAHLIRAACHQFLEGDVQHWWHPKQVNSTHGDKGVRTRCSDDLLWLPYALCEYVLATGDKKAFDEVAPYITSPPLGEDETERYELPTISDVTETLIQHAVRAVYLVLSRGTGQHGLCLMGSGDWNDGMNLVGVGGKGESVWLTWFTIVTASKMANACRSTGNPGTAARFDDAAKQLKIAAENAWDGDWYKRGYYDNGAPLGSSASDECQIDSIAQSFAALADADPIKTKTALTSSIDKLFDRDDRLVRLFDPPFSTGLSVPGYIKGYSPGFRENGGQYTHGAVWLAMGLFLEGMTDDGWNILQTLLPQGRPDEVYKTEPYVLAADVYTAPGHIGRGGWTWYTGAAGWYRRVTLENLLGLRLIGGVLHVRPKLPSSWAGYEAEWRRGKTTYHIKVHRDGRIVVTSSGGTPVSGAVIVD